MEQEEMSGDARRCPEHGTLLSSPDGMHDSECGQCEFLADQEDQYEEEKKIVHDLDESEVYSGLPPGWENAPLSAQVAFLVAGDDPEVFDEIKAFLKGEL